MIVLTDPLVPTGMKVGVLRACLCIDKTPARALPSVAVILKLGFATYLLTSCVSIYSSYPPRSINMASPNERNLYSSFSAKW